MATRSAILALLSLAAVGCEANLQLPDHWTSFAGSPAPILPRMQDADAGPPPEPPQVQGADAGRPRIPPRTQEVDAGPPETPHVQDADAGPPPEPPASPPKPTPESYVNEFTVNAGSLFTFLTSGYAAYPHKIAFFDQPDCTGNDLLTFTRNDHSGRFQAAIEVPPDTRLSSLGFQIKQGEAVTCLAVPVDISTYDFDMLKFDPVSRVRQDDASIDVTLSGTGRGKSIEAFFGDRCEGTLIAAGGIDELSGAWSLPFHWNEWEAKGMAFRLIGSGLDEERCIVAPWLPLLEIADYGVLPNPKVELHQDHGDSLEFLVSVPERQDDKNYYVNISYEYGCDHPVFQGAPHADYLVTLAAPVDALYGYTVGEDYQRTECIKLF
jgi:hypothetical protein